MRFFCSLLQVRSPSGHQDHKLPETREDLQMRRMVKKIDMSQKETDKVECDSR
jgi:hypothetical protein